MRYSRTIALVATALAALVVAGTAQPAVTAARGGSDHVVIETVLYEQAKDRSGQPLGPRVRVDPGEHRLGIVAAARRVHGARATRGLQAASGCKTVWATRIGRSFLFGTTLWKYTQEKYFCWTYPRLTNVKTNAYPCCTDPTWFYKGTVGSSGWFFQWAGSSNGGHYTFRQGRFEQQVLGETIASVQPWVKVWAYGDGSWTYDTGS